MKRFIIAVCVIVNRLVSATIRTGNLLALVLAMFVFCQVETDILTMRGEVKKSLDKVACTARIQSYLAHAQAYAADSAAVTKIEAFRAQALEEELNFWMEDYDRLEASYNRQVIINRSMRVYVERLHKLLRDNNVKIPPQQTRPVGG